jgi:hypothetical protein
MQRLLLLCENHGGSTPSNQQEECWQEQRQKEKLTHAIPRLSQVKTRYSKF